MFLDAPYLAPIFFWPFHRNKRSFGHVRISRVNLQKAVELLSAAWYLHLIPYIVIAIKNYYWHFFFLALALIPREYSCPNFLVLSCMIANILPNTRGVKSFRNLIPDDSRLSYFWGVREIDCWKKRICVITNHVRVIRQISFGCLFFLWGRTVSLHLSHLSIDV
jgi:hypothetical protein